MVQYFLRTLKPRFLGFLTQLIYACSAVTFGKNFRCDGVPKILIDKGATIAIGHNVEFRRNVEIRAHQKASITLGNQVRIDRGVRLLATNKAKIALHDKTRIGLYSVLNGGDSITVGKSSLISGFVYLQTSMHGFKQKNTEVQKQGYQHAAVVLKQDCWLGTHAVILPGVTLGKGAVVGSNAVVTKSVEPYAIVGGVPAKAINSRV